MKKYNLLIFTTVKTTALLYADAAIEQLSANQNEPDPTKIQRQASNEFHILRDGSAHNGYYTI